MAVIVKPRFAKSVEESYIQMVIFILMIGILSIWVFDGVLDSFGMGVFTTGLALLIFYRCDQT